MKLYYDRIYDSKTICMVESISDIDTICNISIVFPVFEENVFGFNGLLTWVYMREAYMIQHVTSSLSSVCLSITDIDKYLILRHKKALFLLCMTMFLRFLANLLFSLFFIYSDCPKIDVCPGIWQRSKGSHSTYAQ